MLGRPIFKVLVLGAALVVSGCGVGAATPSPAPTASPAPSPTPSPTPTPAPTPTPTPAPTEPPPANGHWSGQDEGSPPNTISFEVKTDEKGPYIANFKMFLPVMMPAALSSCTVTVSRIDIQADRTAVIFQAATATNILQGTFSSSTLMAAWVPTGWKCKNTTLRSFLADCSDCPFATMDVIWRKA